MQPRHNVARFRKMLGLTQDEFARALSRSVIAIKMIETGKLALSPGLADAIAVEFGGNPAWLLENDLKAPVPPVKKPGAALNKHERAVLDLLNHLLSRVFASARDITPCDDRDVSLSYHANWELETLKENLDDPNRGPYFGLSAETIRYFQKYAPPATLAWINLDRILDESVDESALQPQRSKSPHQSPEPPSPGGRRKSSKSSANLRDEAR